MKGSSLRERVSRGGHTIVDRPQSFKRWDTLPYGKWTCADGREVLFSRFYEPLLEAMPGGPVREANPKEWVQFKSQEWFYNDSVRSEAAKRRAAEKALAEWRARFEGLGRREAQ